MAGEDVSSPAQLHARLAEMQRLFTGHEPTELRTGLVQIDGGRLMVPGTTARLLHVPYVTRTSGLVGRPRDSSVFTTPGSTHVTSTGVSRSSSSSPCDSPTTADFDAQ